MAQLGRPSWLLRSLLFTVGFAGGLLACGPSKPAADPSSADSPPPAEENTKWEDAKPQPPPGSSPTVAEAKQRRSDEYDKEGTEPVLKRAAAQAKANCGAAKDESGKAIGPWGKTKVSVVLGRNGHSKSASVPPPFDGRPVGRCIVQAFANLTFPPWNGPDATVEWDVEISPPGSK